MSPVWSLLNSTQNDEEWNAPLRGALRSVLAGRQWPQQRCFAAGWTSHNRCLFCLRDVMVHDGDMAADAWDPDASPSSEQLQRTPVGNMFHRNWLCPTLQPLRICKAPAGLAANARRGIGLSNVLYERGLTTRLGVAPEPPKSEATFQWIMQPPDQLISGDVYTDGSRLDGPDADTARNGWAFV
eukprot:2203581-Karenia_brevis.AAC.1